RRIPLERVHPGLATRVGSSQGRDRCRCGSCGRSQWNDGACRTLRADGDALIRFTSASAGAGWASASGSVDRLASLAYSTQVARPRRYRPYRLVLWILYFTVALGFVGAIIWGGVRGAMRESNLHPPADAPAQDPTVCAADLNKLYFVVHQEWEKSR